MKPLSNRVRNTYRILFFIVFLLFVPVLFLYVTGYRLGDTWLSLVETGGIYIYTDQTEVRISVDGEFARQTSFFRRGAFVQDLRPGVYEVSAEKDGYFPWRKKLPITGSRVSEASVLLVRQSPILEIVSTTTATSSQQARLLNTLLKSGTSTVLAPKLRDPLKLSFSTSTKVLTAEWLDATSTAPSYFCADSVCVRRLVVYDANKPGHDMPLHFEFMPGRTDAVLIQTKAGIYAHELDIREPQNVYPVFAPQEGIFRGYFLVNDQSVYIQTNNAWYRIIP